MILLAVDTAETSCSIALVQEGVPVRQVAVRRRLTHSRTLLPLIDQIFCQEEGPRLDQVDRFLVAHGPGSFTGLRIGISVVSGLALAMAKPVSGVSSLDGIAFGLSCSSRPVCAMMDARRGEVYAAVYNFDNGRLAGKTKEAALKPEKALSMAGPDSLFAGSGAVEYSSLILDTFQDRAMIAPMFQNRVDAAALAAAFCSGQATDEHLSGSGIRPVYLRRSDAEINFKPQPGPGVQ